MAKLRTMASMELTDDESLDAVMPIPMKDRPSFPYGLRVCITDAEFSKLGLSPEGTQVGEIFRMFALARVTSVAMNETEDGPCWRVEAQIENLALESEDDEAEAY